MQRIKCQIAYDGSQFSGFQVQPHKRTVQGEFERVLQKLHKGEPVKVVGSGRTDAGVHARGQIIHFDSSLSIPEDKWPLAINSILPEDISILKVDKVDSNFHARFNVIEKEYRYIVYTAKTRNPFQRNFAYHYPFSVDTSKMEEAGNFLIGTHDFTSFCSAKTEVGDKVRELKRVQILEEDGFIIFRFIGNGFLYNMVRILVGTLLQVGTGDIEVASIPAILAEKNRAAAGKTAPPQGLYLWEVRYE